MTAAGPWHVAVAAPLALDAVADLLDDAVPAHRAISGGTPIAHLVRGLTERGHAVTVVTGDVGRTEELVLRGPQLTVHLGPYRSAHRARDLFRAERRYVSRALHGAHPHVVHAHWTYEFALGALASGRPTVVTVRDWAPTILRHHPHPYRMVRLLLAMATLARARHLTVTSPYMQRLVRRWTRRRAALVHNAISDADFVPRAVVAARSSAGPAPTVVAVNNGFDHRKNVTSLIAAWPHVRAATPHASLVLIGSGYGSGGEASTWARERSLGDGIVFSGPQPNAEAMRRVAASDVFVHPSREESFGLVLVEAMARGVPVVAGQRSGAVPWVLDDGRAGTLVDVADPEAIAAGILATLRDPASTRERALHGYDRAWRDFRMTRTLEAYEHCYEQAMRERA